MKELAIDIISLIANCTIAIVALFSGVISRHFRRPRIEIPNENLHSYISRTETLEIEDEDDSSNKKEIDKDQVFSIPFLNHGRGVAEDVRVSTKAILKRGSDGDSFDVLYEGLPRYFKWMNGNECLNILGHDDAYLKFIEVKKTTANTTKNKKSKSEKVTCFLCAKEMNTVTDDIKLARTRSVTCLVLLSYRATNMSRAYEEWIFVYWQPNSEMLLKRNFTIRKAKKDEINCAKKELKSYRVVKG